jgi:hypothetical protein
MFILGTTRVHRSGYKNKLMTKGKKGNLGKSYKAMPKDKFCKFKTRILVG